MKFKVGDRVQIHPEAVSVFAGQTARVHHYRSFTSIPVVVIIGSNGKALAYMEDELIKINEKGEGKCSSLFMKLKNWIFRKDH